MTKDDLTFACRGSNGLYVYQGLEKPTIAYQYVVDRKRLKEENKAHVSVKFAEFSPNGQYLAYGNGERVAIVCTDTWQEYMSLDGPIHMKTSAVKFSPKSNFLCTWQVIYTSLRQQQNTHSNLFVLDLNSKKLVAEFVDKSKQNWHPQWTDDECVFSRLVGSEVLFHESSNLQKYVHKLVLPKMSDYALSCSAKNLHVAAYVPLGKDTPAIVKVYQYPNFQFVVNAKSFFKADHVSMKWNKKGTALIIMAITDIDSTGQSYYGEQNLYFVSTSGDSYMVPLGKNGPVYWVEWSPSSNCFCVVYGYMPAKATLYNLKGDVVYDFGTGPRNEAHYDPFGKVLCLCGFGNLRGNMEFFNAACGGGVECRRLCNAKAEDTTLFRWSSDGQHFLTATTSPRLRVNNGWKIWTYDGRVVAERNYAAEDELWDACWCPNLSFVEKPLLDCAANSPSVSSKPFSSLPGVNASGAYVPPHLRSATASTNKPTFKLHEYEPPSDEKHAVNSKPGSKSAKNRNKTQAALGSKVLPASSNVPSVHADEDTAKKIKNLQKKLDQIRVLKEKLGNGEQLEVNQLQKIDKEHKLQEELEQLSLH